MQVTRSELRTGFCDDWKRSSSKFFRNLIFMVRTQNTWRFGVRKEEGKWGITSTVMWRKDWWMAIFGALPKTASNIVCTNNNEMNVLKRTQVQLCYNFFDMLDSLFHKNIFVQMDNSRQLDNFLLLINPQLSPQWCYYYGNVDQDVMLPNSGSSKNGNILMLYYADGKRGLGLRFFLTSCM